jgi:hypothetical protein
MKDQPMTIEMICDGLEALVQRLANNVDTTEPPDGWMPEQWAYVKGLASGQIISLRDRLVQRP